MRALQLLDWSWSHNEVSNHLVVKVEKEDNEWRGIDHRIFSETTVDTDFPPAKLKYFSKQKHEDLWDQLDER